MTIFQLRCIAIAAKFEGRDLVFEPEFILQLCDAYERLQLDKAAAEARLTNMTLNPDPYGFGSLPGFNPPPPWKRPQ